MKPARLPAGSKWQPRQRRQQRGVCESETYLHFDSKLLIVPKFINRSKFRRRRRSLLLPPIGYAVACGRQRRKEDEPEKFKSFEVRRLFG